MASEAYLQARKATLYYIQTKMKQTNIQDHLNSNTIDKQVITSNSSLPLLTARPLKQA
jgi:hypothetical protein